jgi:toxin ParE1/3/4
VKVVLTEAALADLVGIGRFISLDNPSRAETFLAELEDRCKRLDTLALAYPLLPGREATGIRRRPYQNYLIFYRIFDQTVEILHVVHGARDYDAILFPDD